MGANRAVYINRMFKKSWSGFTRSYLEEKTFDYGNDISGKR
jgi:hypothetical protein